MWHQRQRGQPQDREVGTSGRDPLQRAPSAPPVEPQRGQTENHQHGGNGLARRPRHRQGDRGRHTTETEDPRRAAHVPAQSHSQTDPGHAGQGESCRIFRHHPEGGHGFEEQWVADDRRTGGEEPGAHLPAAVRVSGRGRNPHRRISQTEGDADDRRDRPGLGQGAEDEAAGEHEQAAADQRRRRAERRQGKIGRGRERRRILDGGAGLRHGFRAAFSFETRRPPLELTHRGLQGPDQPLQPFQSFVHDRS